MIDWIKSLFDSMGEKPPAGVADPALLLELREELRRCEALYRAGAYLCIQTCPDQIGSPPEKFPDLMLDLHRGLLIKVFMQLARCDRRWHPAEQELAVVLLQHVWGVDISSENLAQVLQNVAGEAETLSWESLLKPFANLLPLADQVPELQSQVFRIANLVAKADGKVLPAEVQCLRSIQASMRRALQSKGNEGESSPPQTTRSGREAVQVARAQRPAESSRNDDKKLASPAEQKNRTNLKSPDEMLAEAMAEMDQLVGMDVVKEDIRQLVDFLKVQAERQKHDLPRTQVALHAVFRGNPGTGKTTVARILGRIFGGLGLLNQGHTVETDRSGLVAEYSGQTGPKVNKLVDEALHGVLFVDEAYSLVAERGDDPFGTEAVQVLLKRMEDDRENLVVVLAGYPRPMDRMIGSNPGLASRFQRTFDFPDYSADELLEIFRRMCETSHYVLPEATREKLRTGFQSLVAQRDEHFGNARLARNLFENAIQRMASRIVEIAPLTREHLTRLHPEDISFEDAT